MVFLFVLNNLTRSFIHGCFFNEECVIVENISDDIYNKYEL